MKLSPSVPSITLAPLSSGGNPLRSGTSLQSFSQMLSDKKLEAILQRGMSMKQLNPTELIQTQIAVGKYQLKVELVTKCAEGINATLRRIQQGV